MIVFIEDGRGGDASKRAIYGSAYDRRRAARESGARLPGGGRRGRCDERHRRDASAAPPPRAATRPRARPRRDCARRPGTATTRTRPFDGADRASAAARRARGWHLPASAARSRRGPTTHRASDRGARTAWRAPTPSRARGQQVLAGEEAATRGGLGNAEQRAMSRCDVRREQLRGAAPPPCSERRRFVGARSLQARRVGIRQSANRRVSCRGRRAARVCRRRTADQSTMATISFATSAR